jgi:hypothetical protein
MERGRPSIYTQEIAALICEGLARGMTLREVCKAPDMPGESTVRNWALTDHCGFFAHYAKAREIGYHCMADETIDIADNAANDWMERNGENDQGWQINGEHIQRSRLRIDTRKWLLSKALPKIYGDKSSVELSGPDGGAIPMPTRIEIVSVPVKNDDSTD